MEKSIDLKEIERKAYLAYHQDGVWDLFIGGGFFIAGIGMFFDFAYILAAVGVALVPLVSLVKKAVTVPRLGYVKFGPERQAKEKRNRYAYMVLLWIVMFAGMFLFAVYSFESSYFDWLRGLGAIPFGFVVVLLTTAGAFLYGIKRLYAYAVLFAVVFLAGHFSDLRLYYFFIIPGAIILISGLILLMRFIRMYPKGENQYAG